MRAKAAGLLEELDSRDLDVTPRSAASRSPAASASKIAKALSQNPRVLVNGRATTSLAEGDVSRLMAIVRALARARAWESST